MVDGMSKKIEKLVEVRTFLPKSVVDELDKRKGRWGNTRSEVTRYILLNWKEGKGEIGVW